MSVSTLKVAVIGAGTMGNGIAHVFAQSGHHVSLIDVHAAALERAQAMTRSIILYSYGARLSKVVTDGSTVNFMKLFSPHRYCQT